MKTITDDYKRYDPNDHSKFTNWCRHNARRVGFGIVWVIGTITYPFVIFIHDYCYMGLCRLFSPAYKKHMYWLGMQNQHLDGLHSEGPDPNCEYCAEVVKGLADGGFYRPWSRAEQSPA